MFLIWIILGVVAYYFFVKNRDEVTAPAKKQNQTSALDALSLRYANGEIDENEYHKMKEILSE